MRSRITFRVLLSQRGRGDVFLDEVLAQPQLNPPLLPLTHGLLGTTDSTPSPISSPAGLRCRLPAVPKLAATFGSVLMTARGTLSA